MIGTLSLYIARRFAAAFAAAFGAVFLVVFLVDLVEQLRRAGGAGFEVVATMALLHAPALMLDSLPFIALLAAIACFARLARSSELVVTRAAGVSVWRLLAPALLSAAAIGAAATAVLNPLAAGMLHRFEALEARHVRDRPSLLSVSANGLWLRQSGPEGQSVLHARRANPEGTNLWDVTLFRFDAGDRLVGRTEAGRAVLEPGAWALFGVRDWTLRTGLPHDAAPSDAEVPLSAAEAAPAPVRVERLDLPTDLTPAQILESFASPKTISFWAMPRFIAALEAAGLSAQRHRMHWQAQTAKPLLLASMVLIGAAFSMRHVRFGGLGLMALGAIGAGLGYFFLANLTEAFGALGAIAPPLAAWIPPVAISLAAAGLLLHLEDG